MYIIILKINENEKLYYSDMHKKYSYGWEIWLL